MLFELLGPIGAFALIFALVMFIVDPDPFRAVKRPPCKACGVVGNGRKCCDVARRINRAVERVKADMLVAEGIEERMRNEGLL